MEQFMDCKIDAKTLEDFTQQLETLLCAQYAKNKKGIVYFWKVSNPIHRVKNSSRIIYIGQSKNSLQDRYYNSKSLNIENNILSDTIRK